MKGIGFLGEMADSRMRKEIYKMSLGHLVVLKTKEVNKIITPQ